MICISQWARPTRQVCHVVWLLLVLSSHQAHSTEITRHAVIIGNNVGTQTEAVLRYAEEDARRMAHALTDLGGFQPKNVHLLLGASADDVRSAWDRIERNVQTEHALVVFYYSGHGDEVSLHLGDTFLPLMEVNQFVKKQKSNIRIALVDACRSGALIRSKGARPGPMVELDLVDPTSATGSIVISSSSREELSQESDLLQGSFFTHYWVAGLYGQADENQDEIITLDEAYRYAYYHTVTQTMSTQFGVQNPSYDFQLSGENIVVLAKLHEGTGKVKIRTGEQEGRYFVIDSRRKIVLTEIITDKRESTAIDLPPGNYQIRKREDDHLKTIDLHVRENEERVVEEKDMQTVHYDSPTRKGEGRLENAIHSPMVRLLPTHQQPQLGLGVRSPLTESMTLTPEIRLAYRLNWDYGFVTPRLITRGAGLGADEVTAVYTEIDVGVSVGPAFQLGLVDLSMGIDSGVIALSMRDLRAQQMRLMTVSPDGILSVAFQGNLLGEIGINLFPWLRMSGTVYAGLALMSLNQEANFLPHIGAAFNTGVVF